MPLLFLLLSLLAFSPPAYADNKFLGLLEVPALCARPCPNSDKPVPLYTAPYMEEPSHQISRTLYIEQDPDIQNSESPLWPHTLDLADKEAAAIVYELVENIAYKIRIADDYYWVKAEDAGRFHPYPQILKSRLAYLRKWNFWLWDKPGGGQRHIPHPAQKNPLKAEEIPVRVTALEKVRGHWWMQIEIFSRSRCLDPSAPLLTKGWVPAYKQDGGRTAWFYPAGCK